MGIDIYLSWRNQKEEQQDAQLTGFSVVHGHVGYLREAYHGEPYATRHLVPEAFGSEDGTAEIPAAVLRARLPETLAIAEERERTVYNETDPEAIADVKRSFIDFVELAEAMERATGAPCTVTASY
jgi:hypothetical protein